MSLSLFWAANLAADTEPACQVQFQSTDILSEVPISYRGQILRTYRMNSVGLGLFRSYRANLILPHLDPERRLIIGFTKGGHSYVTFRNYRFDSQGTAGISVLSELQSDNVFVDGALIFVVPNLSDAEVNAIEDYAESFQSQRTQTCIQSVCRVLQRVDPSILGNRQYFLPTGLIQRLVDLKVSGQRDLEIVSLNGATIDTSVRNIQEKQREGVNDFATIIGIPLMFVLPYLYYFLH